MIFAKVAQGKTVQMPLVGRIAERTEIGVMGSDDQHAPTGLEQPMEFLYRPDDVGDMFDQVDRTDFTKARVLKREREVIEIRDHVGIGVNVPINSDCTRILLDSTTHVKYPVGEIGRR